MIKTGGNYDDIYNYRNSRYFIKSVIEARKNETPGKDIVIFAGACQSYFEAIMASRGEFCIITSTNTNRFYGSTYCCRKDCNNK